MKREQLDKIVYAAIALRNTIEGAERLSVASTHSGGVRVSIDFDTDEDACATAVVLGSAAHRHESVLGEWFMLAFVDWPGVTIMLSGPHHESKAQTAQTDDATVESALAQAADAIGGDS